LWNIDIPLSRKSRDSFLGRKFNRNSPGKGWRSSPPACTAC